MTDWAVASRVALLHARKKIDDRVTSELIGFGQIGQDLRHNIMATVNAEIDNIDQTIPESDS